MTIHNAGGTVTGTPATTQTAPLGASPAARRGNPVVVQHFGVERFAQMVANQLGAVTAAGGAKALLSHTNVARQLLEELPHRSVLDASRAAAHIRGLLDPGSRVDGEVQKFARALLADRGYVG